MSIARKIMMGAAGAGGDATYVDDVFSTYLWEGNDESGRSISNGIKLSNNNIGNSVYLNGASEYLSIPSSSDFAFGTGDFTWEGWFYINDDGSYLISFGADVGNIDYYTWQSATRRLRYYNSVAGFHEITDPASLSLSTWYHIAAARSSGTTKVFLNGTEKLSFTDNKDYGAEALYLGATSAGGSRLTGNISNVRIVKGQALYTSSFTPSTQALTTTSQGATASNVKLLCCNKSTPTGATVTPGTITAHGSPLSQGFGPFTGNDGEGGLVWIKSRTTGHVNCLFDTERGANQRLRSDSNLGQNNTDTLQPLFTNSGFTVGGGNEVNGAGNNYASWTWRKQKGFFDIVTWTGNSTAGRQIAHNLGSVPGCIMVKNLSAGYEWAVYHRSLGGTSSIQLSSSSAPLVNNYFWYNTDPTATHFTVGTSTDTNRNGDNFVAYIFAGGPSTAATARSVNFARSSSQGLSLASTSDFAYGTGDFTVEAWIKLSTDTGTFYFVDHGGDNFSSGITSNQWFYYNGSAGTQYGGNATENIGLWTHFAISRSSGTTKIFINGVERNSFSDTHNFPAQNTNIGHYQQSQHFLNGNISNLRIVKGTALYTTSFKPPYETLTNISGTVLLCCNNASVTGATVTPGAITAHNTPTASTDSPFDDPEGFKFGEEGDQNLIKCGSYIGNSTANHEIEIGWEPQWWLVKNVTGAQNWQLLDSMRGWVNNGNDEYLVPNNNSAESAFNFGNPTPTGFNLSNSSSDWQNASGSTYVYIAIRRPDPLVAKPAEAGTDAFTVRNSETNGSEGAPWFKTPHVVDFQTFKNRTTTDNWWTSGRIYQGKYLQTNTNAAEASNAYQLFDYMNGYNSYTGTTGNYTGYLWKRYAGFDVVAYSGTGANRVQSHSLGRVPEMVVVKKRNATQNWYTYHKGLNGGTNPELKTVMLNSTDAEDSAGSFTFNNTAPTSTVFSLASSHATNGSGDTYIALLFASVEGISKVGSYSGPGGVVTITTGFQPRFIIVKKTSGAGGWHVFDTVRGMGSGNDPLLYLNTNGAQITVDYVTPSSTGWSTTSGNLSEGDYIYYAHA